MTTYPVAPLNPDIVRQGAGPDQVGVHVQAGEELFGQPADEFAVGVDGFEGFAGGCMIAMQGFDLAVGGDLHQPVRWSWRTGANRSIRVARSTDATGSSPIR